MGCVLCSLYLCLEEEGSTVVFPARVPRDDLDVVAAHVHENSKLETRFRIEATVS